MVQGSPRLTKAYDSRSPRFVAIVDRMHSLPNAFFFEEGRVIVVKITPVAIESLHAT